MKKFILLIIIQSLFLISFAQKISFKARSKTVVSVGERFQLSYTLNSKGNNFSLGKINGFRILSGPNPSSSTSVTVINGQVSQSINQSYSYILQAVKEGKYSISPASITVKGKKYTSNAIQIEVVKGNSNTQNNNNNRTSNNTNIKNTDVYMRLIPSKQTVVKGEPLSIRIKFYTRLNLSDLQNPKFPEYTGFYSQEIESPQNISLQRENINGTIYNTAILGKVLLYPQRSGDLKINPAEIDAIIQQRIKNRRRSVFDDFFGSSYRNIRKHIRSNSLTIHVKKLPKNTPLSFSGTVGSFKIKASANPLEISTDDALTYKITISGLGNIKLIDNPKIEFPHDFDVWDPTIKNKIKNTAEGSQGSKTFEYIIQARHPGDFTIPAYSFSYFDIKSRKYKTIQTQAINIKVKQGSKTNTQVSTSNLSKEEVALIGQDIRYIKTNKIILKEKTKAFFGTVNYYLSFLGGILLFVLIFILKRKQLKNASNTRLIKNKKARKKATKKLKTAKKKLEEEDIAAFYEEIHKALQGYISDKLNINISDFNMEKMLETLNKKGIDDTLSAELKALINESEFVRFAPSQAQTKPQEIYKNAVQIISNLENKLK